MAKHSLAIIQTIRRSAKKLELSTIYQWGHMGSCNCGFLAQEVTKLTKEEIHTRAMMRHGDWTEQLNDYCPVNGLPMDDLISELLVFGFDSDDLRHLEKLSDGKILRTIPLEERDLKHNLKKDVVKYMKAWADLLEEELVGNIALPSFEEKKVLVH
jgi:hypothetical protein